MVDQTRNDVDGAKTTNEPPRLYDRRQSWPEESPTLSLISNALF
jgi:hypothetical protein